VVMKSFYLDVDTENHIFDVDTENHIFELGLCHQFYSASYVVMRKA